jgi:hypothetical protein
MIMGIVASHVLGRKNYRVLAVGPPHLNRRGKRGSKWCREIEHTIPDGQVVHLDDHAQLLHLAEWRERHRDRTRSRLA